MFFIPLADVSPVACSVLSIIAIPLLRETYGPVIRMRRAAKAGDLENFLRANPHLAAEHGKKLDVLWDNLARPLLMLSRSMICFILSLYMALYVTISKHGSFSFLSDLLYLACTESTTSCSPPLLVRSDLNL